MGSIDENGQSPSEVSMQNRSQDDPAADMFFAMAHADRERSGPEPLWARWEKADDAPAPPPVWTRYVESRLRQFGEGR